MFRLRRRAIAIALLMVLPLVLAACSATGGKKAAQAAEGGGTAVAAGHANTKHYTVAVITHAAAGDTFWDIIDTARASAGPGKPFHEALVDHLATRTRQDILQYQETMRRGARSPVPVGRVGGGLPHRRRLLGRQLHGLQDRPQSSRP